jgi:hypothetical protein
LQQFHPTIGYSLRIKAQKIYASTGINRAERPLSAKRALGISRIFHPVSYECACAQTPFEESHNEVAKISFYRVRAADACSFFALRHGLLVDGRIDVIGQLG